MKFSKKIQSIEPSLARDLFNKAKMYDNVIDLTLGDPDYDTPSLLKKAACDAINANKTHYSPNAGLIEARIAAAKNIERVWGISADPQNEILITVGGMEALYLSLFSILDPDDEVIVFAPYYCNYIQMIKSCDGKPIIVDAYSEEQGLIITEEMIRSVITDKTVAIIINSPSNPTGAAIPQESLRIIADLAEEFDLTIISDEVYHSLIYDGLQHQSVLQFEQARKRTVLIDSMSKEFCMTGWRVGYLFAPQELVSSIVRMQENVASCVSLPSQYAMIKAYEDGLKCDYVDKFQERRDHLYNLINKIKGLKCRNPQGTFYMFVDISTTGLTSIDFANLLLENQQVAIIPGITYGQSYDKYIRIAFTKDISLLEKACKKIEKFIYELNSRAGG